MLLGLFAALAASVCYGVATVLQAVSARAAPHTADVDPRLLLRLSRQVPFLAGDFKLQNGPCATFLGACAISLIGEEELA